MWIIITTKSNIYKQVEDIPYNEIGLVLGTSNKEKGGGENLFFKERMATTFALWKAGKINIIIVSGDNRTQYYNEPKMMKEALLKLGIPSNKIRLDTAGFRTIESIKNAKKIVGLKKITIITQKFHGYRALFISKHYNLNAQVMQTHRLPLKYSGNVRIREFFARVKAFLELYIIA